MLLHLALLSFLLVANAECNIPTTPSTVSVVSWNMAAINNNPFEYHIGGTSPQHQQFISKISALIIKAGVGNDG